MANKKSHRKALSLITKHLLLAERAKALFTRSGAALDAAIAAGVPLNEDLVLKSGLKVVVTDQFAETNHAFSAKLFNRYVVGRRPKYERPRKETVNTNREGQPGAKLEGGK